MAIDVPTLVAEIHERLEAAGDARRREAATWYFPTAMEVFGAGVPDLRKVARDIASRLKSTSTEEVLELALAVVADGVFEGRQTAYEILSRHKPTMARLLAADVEQLGEGMDNWASVDAFSSLVAGPAWRDGQLTDADIMRWAVSKDRWWRRASLASTTTLNRKSQPGDARRTLMVCDLHVSDKDDMVVKALSWALRALAGHDPKAVEDFLSRNDGVLPSRVRREVRNKLDTGLKNPTRKA